MALYFVVRVTADSGDGTPTKTVSDVTNGNIQFTIALTTSIVKKWLKSTIADTEIQEIGELMADVKTIMDATYPGVPASIAVEEVDIV